MKKTLPARSKSTNVPPKNLTQARTKPKLGSRRATAPSLPPQTVKTRTTKVPRKGVEKVEEEVTETVIDLNKQEDATKLVEKLFTFLNVQVPLAYDMSSLLYARNNIGECNPYKKTTRHKDEFYTRLKSNDIHKQQLMCYKLPSLGETRDHSLFQIRYSRPTNYQSLQDRLQKLSPRPFSRAVFDDRGMTFSRMQANESRETQHFTDRDTSHQRSRTFPGLTTRETNFRKSKTGRYSVTFVDDFTAKTHKETVLV